MISKYFVFADSENLLPKTDFGEVFVIFEKRGVYL